jgi:transcriptional regulator CtsR
MLSSRTRNIGDKQSEKYIRNMCCSKTPLNILFILWLCLLTEKDYNAASKRSNASYLHILKINCKNHNVICYCVMYRLNNLHKRITIHSVWEKLLHMYTVNIIVEWLALLLCIQDVSGSILGPGTGHSDFKVSYLFKQFHQANAATTSFHILPNSWFTNGANIQPCITYASDSVVK